MNVWMLVLLIGIAVLAFEAFRLRRRVALLEKARDVVQRHFDHIYWKLDGSPMPGPSDLHVVWTTRREEPGPPGGST